MAPTQYRGARKGEEGHGIGSAPPAVMSVTLETPIPRVTTKKKGGVTPTLNGVTPYGDVRHIAPPIQQLSLNAISVEVIGVDNLANPRVFPSRFKLVNLVVEQPLSEACQVVDVFCAEEVSVAALLRLNVKELTGGDVFEGERAVLSRTHVHAEVAGAELFNALVFFAVNQLNLHGGAPFDVFPWFTLDGNRVMLVRQPRKRTGYPHMGVVVRERGRGGRTGITVAHHLSR